MLITALHHVALSVADFDMSAAWYARHFGFKMVEQWRNGDTRIGLLAAGEVRIELFCRPSATAGPDEEGDLMGSFSRRGWKHVAFTVSDLDATLLKLAAGGITPFAGPADAPPGFRYAFLRDPDGHHVELVAD